MNKISDSIQAVKTKLRTKNEVSARRALLEELFQDYYVHRKDIYKMNFVRGIFFGFGSVLGGTLVVAILVWLLSTLINLPIGGELVESVRNSLKTE